MDVAVIETGIGGRTDATNVIESPVVCGITSIGFIYLFSPLYYLGWDHMDVLGDTLGKIAYEKSGIFKVFSFYNEINEIERSHWLILCSSTS